jgi:nucleolar MIF4G domain-containing protein 1
MKIIKKKKNEIEIEKEIESLNVKWSEFENAPINGRWWIIGAAWTKDKSNNLQTNNDYKHFDNSLLELAVQHRMNTHIRKSVFCVLLSRFGYYLL